LVHIYREFVAGMSEFPVVGRKEHRPFIVGESCEARGTYARTP